MEIVVGHTKGGIEDLPQLEIDTFKHFPELIGGFWQGLRERLDGLDLDEIAKGIKNLQDSIGRSASL